MPKAYTSLQAALAAAKRIANRTGRQVRVTAVQGPARAKRNPPGSPPAIAPGRARQLLKEHQSQHLARPRDWLKPTITPAEAREVASYIGRGGRFFDVAAVLAAAAGLPTWEDDRGWIHGGRRVNPTGLTFSNDPGPGKDIGIYRPVRWKRKGGKVRKTRPKMRIPMADLADLHAGWQELRDEAASRRVTGRRSNPARLPRWDSRKGWIGGDTRTLYAFTDRRTGRVVVMPGPGTRFGSTAVGDFADVRPATRDEAERLWQSPLHSGWKVK